MLAKRDQLGRVRPGQDKTREKELFKKIQFCHGLQRTGVKIPEGTTIISNHSNNQKSEWFFLGCQENGFKFNTEDS